MHYEYRVYHEHQLISQTPLLQPWIRPLRHRTGGKPPLTPGEFASRISRAVWARRLLSQTRHHQGAPVQR
jgi:hypothetical protein